MTSPMLTVSEVAQELAVCRVAVYALLERGEVERVLPELAGLSQVRGEA